MNDTTGFALAGAGGLAAGKLIADSDFANRLLVRWLTRRAPTGGRPDFRVPVLASADPNLAHGSGEAVMATNIADRLGRNGIGSYYVNTASHVRPDMLNPGMGEEVVRNGLFWSDGAVIDGKNIERLDSIPVDRLRGHTGTARSALVEMLSRKAGITQAQADALLRSGRFDGMSAGELYDTVQVMKPNVLKGVIAGKSGVMPRNRFMQLLQGGKLPHALTTEAGMGYSSIGADPRAVAALPYPFDGAPRTRNLALDTRFQANYRGDPRDPLIPGSAAYDPYTEKYPALKRIVPAPVRRSRIARWLARNTPYVGERAQLLRAVRALADKNGVPSDLFRSGDRYMLISTGSAGANAAEKLRLAEKALADNPRNHVILQYGKAPASGGLDMYTNNGLAEELARVRRAHPGFVLAADRLPGYNMIARNVDLHGAYGGSSSITEAMSNLNPTLSMTDTVLNEGNSGYARNVRGIPRVNAGGTALGRLVRSGASDSTLVNTRDRDGRTLIDALKKMRLSRNTDFGQMERDAVSAIRDAMNGNGNWFSRENVAGANRVLRDQSLRDKTFTSDMYKLVQDSIARHDKAAFRGSRGASRLAKGLQRVLFRTPMGRRIGIPLAAATALGGLGAYAMSK